MVTGFYHRHVSNGFYQFTPHCVPYRNTEANLKDTGYERVRWNRLEHMKGAVMNRVMNVGVSLKKEEC